MMRRSTTLFPTYLPTLLVLPWRSVPPGGA
jgi:hypothetical protein